MNFSKINLDQFTQVTLALNPYPSLDISQVLDVKGFLQGLLRRSEDNLLIPGAQKTR